MSSQKTTNYDLNQWLPDDSVLRTDFNADNAKIDAALQALADTAAGKADAGELSALENTVAEKAEAASVAALDSRALRWASGSYTGTGTYGSGAPMTLDFTNSLGRPPVFLLVRQEQDNSTTKSPVLAAVRGVTYCSVFPSLINTGGATCSMTWSGNTVTWYGSAAEQQMNKSGSKYCYFAVG